MVKVGVRWWRGSTKFFWLQKRLMAMKTLRCLPWQSMALSVFARAGLIRRVVRGRWVIVAFEVVV